MKIFGTLFLFALLSSVAAAQGDPPVSDELLEKYDKDGDGKLSEEELAEARRDLGGPGVRGGRKGARQGTTTKELGLTPLALEGVFAWETDLEGAVEKARVTGRPLLISMHVSTEKACERMLKRIYTDPEVRAKLARFVVLPTCPDAHEEITEKVDGKERKVSALFKTVDCQTLARNEEEVRKRFFDTARIKVPRHVFVGDDGKIFMTRDFAIKKSDFLDLLDKVLVTYGLKRLGGLDSQFQDYFNKIKNGKGDDREEAVKEVLHLGVEEMNEFLYPTIQSLKKEEDRALCIRAMGYKEFKAAAPVAMQWLTDKSTHLRNCTVVTLEEMEALVAVEPLLELFASARDKELKKDILRALGPCGKGNAEAKALLLEEVKSKDEKMRLACYLSLGHFLDDEEVLSLMKERYRKEGRNTLLKTGILWGFRSSTEEFIVEVEGLVKKEKNHQLKVVAEAVVRFLDMDPGADRRGGGGWNRELWSATRALYAEDEIVRNQLKGRRENVPRGGRGR